MNMQRPPDALRQRVLRSLKDQGLVREPSRPRMRGVLAAIIVLAALAAGFGVGRMRTETGYSGPRFAFLLYEDSTFRAAHTPGSGVAEYTAWARTLAAEGKLESGEKLGALARSVGNVAAPVQGDGSPTGLFIIHAPDLAAAAEIARTSPHVRYGGTIVVHAIE